MRLNTHPYAGKAFQLDITVLDAYPFTAPRVVFATPIYHYAVDATGGACLPITLDAWSPAKVLPLTVQSTVTPQQPMPAMRGGELDFKSISLGSPHVRALWGARVSNPTDHLQENDRRQRRYRTGFGSNASARSFLRPSTVSWASSRISSPPRRCTTRPASTPSGPGKRAKQFSTARCKCPPWNGVFWCSWPSPTPQWCSAPGHPVGEYGAWLWSCPHA